MNDVETKRPAQVFLSYTSEDSASARVIAEALRRRGVSTWFAESDILWGENLVEKVETAARSRDYILLLLSPAAVGSEWVK